MTIEIKRTSPGEFAALRDGEPTGYGIVNGSLGVSGHGQNLYGITKPDGSTRWVGTLQAAKKVLTRTLEQR
jgi:hypothetical protein